MTILLELFYLKLGKIILKHISLGIYIWKSCNTPGANGGVRMLHIVELILKDSCELWYIMASHLEPIRVVVASHVLNISTA